MGTSSCGKSYRCSEIFTIRHTEKPPLCELVASSPTSQRRHVRADCILPLALYNVRCVISSEVHPLWSLQRFWIRTLRIVNISEHCTYRCTSGMPANVRGDQWNDGPVGAEKDGRSALHYAGRNGLLHRMQCQDFGNGCVGRFRVLCREAS